MTEEEIIELGFEMVKQYDHDDFKTNRYQKGSLEVEFTYKDGKRVSVDMTIEEINCLPITADELKLLDKILN